MCVNIVTHHLRIVVAVFNSGNISRQKVTSRSVSMISTTAMLLIPEQTKPREELNKQYIFFGGGTIIAMFIIVIVLQMYTCKRSKSAKIKTLSQKKCEETDMSEELVDDEHHRNIQSETTMPTVRNKNKENQKVESDYCDVDEFLDFENNPSGVSNISTGYEQPQTMQNPTFSYSPLTPRSSFHFQRLNDHFVEPINDQCKENNSNLYLQPISVLEILCKTEINAAEVVDEIN